MRYGINITAVGVSRALWDAAIASVGVVVRPFSERVMGVVERQQNGVVQVRRYIEGNVRPGMRWIFDRSVVDPAMAGVHLGQRFLDRCRPYAMPIGIMGNFFYAGGCAIRFGSGVIRALRTGEIMDVQTGHGSRMFHYFDYPGSHIALVNFALRVHGLVGGVHKHVWGAGECSAQYLQAVRELDAARDRLPEVDDDVQTREQFEAQEAHIQALEQVRVLEEWDLLYTKYCNSRIDNTGSFLFDLQMLSWGVRNIAETANKWLRSLGFPLIPTVVRSFLLLGCTVVSTPSSIVGIFRNTLAAVRDPRFCSTVLDAKSQCNEDAVLKAFVDYLLLEKEQNQYYLMGLMEVLFLIGNVPTLIAFAGAYSSRARNVIVDMPYGVEFYSLSAGPINWLTNSFAVGLLMYQKIATLRYRNHRYTTALNTIWRSMSQGEPSESSTGSLRVKILTRFLQQLANSDEEGIRAKQFLRNLNVLSDADIGILIRTAATSFAHLPSPNTALQQECTHFLCKSLGLYNN